MFAMNLKNRAVLGAANMYSYFGASRSLVGSASLAQEECSQTKLFYQELQNVNLAAHVLTCKKEDGGGLCSVFLLPVSHKHEISIRNARYLAGRFRPNGLFLEMDDMRFKTLEKKKEICEFQVALEVSKSLNPDLEVICGDIADHGVRSLFSDLSSLSNHLGKHYDRRDQYEVDEAEARGMDGSHWLVVHEPPFQIKFVEFYAQYYANLLAPYLGMSEKEAIKVIYSISLDAYFGFGAVLTEDTVEKLRGRDDIIMVIPDIYVNTLHKLYAVTKTKQQLG